MERAGMETYIFPQMWHFLALAESRLLWVCLCLDRLELVA